MVRIIKPGYVAALLLALITANCKKECDGENLPALSMSGKNIFGCKINGKCWVAQGYSDFGTGINVPAISGGFWPRPNNGKMNLYIVAQRPYMERVELFIRNETAERFLNPGIFPLNKNTFVLDFASSFNEHLVKDYGALNFTTTDSTHTGWIEIIKLDTVNKIISGRFEFSVIGSSITEGRFDISN